MKSARELYGVLVFGTMWGAIELFGGDFMRSQGLPYRAAVLSALGLTVLVIAKRWLPAMGSAVAIGAVACLYKLASNGFYSCQLLAVMIHATTFDVFYTLLRERLDSSAWTRALAALGITAVSFSVFGFVNTYVIPEPHWAERGLPGILDYLSGSGVVAAVLGVIALALGHRVVRRMGSESARRLVLQRPVPIGVSASVTIACWAAGLLFALL